MKLIKGKILLWGMDLRMETARTNEYWFVLYALIRDRIYDRIDPLSIAIKHRTKNFQAR